MKIDFKDLEEFFTTLQYRSMSDKALALKLCLAGIALLDKPEATELHYFSQANNIPEITYGDNTCYVSAR